MLLYHLQTRTVQSKRYPEEVLTTCSATEERFMCWLLRFVEAPADKMRVSCQKFPLVHRWKRRAKKFCNAPTKAEQRKSGSRYTRRGNNAGFKMIKKSALRMFVRAHRQNVSWREEPTGDRSRRSVSVRARLQMENTRAYILFFYIRVRRTMTFHGHLR